MFQRKFDALPFNKFPMDSKHKKSRYVFRLKSMVKRYELNVFAKNRNRKKRKK